MRAPPQMPRERMMPYTAQVGHYQLQYFAEGGRRLVILASNDGDVTPYRIMGVDGDSDGTYEQGLIFNGSTPKDPLNCQWGYKGTTMPACASYNHSYGVRMLEHAIAASTRDGQQMIVRRQ